MASEVKRGLIRIAAGYTRVSRVVVRGAEAFAVVLLAAPFNRYHVTARMVAYNA
ncbi:MAG: hypothetical protein IH889_04725 [Planctomycetes bacterium]|nr:hypothetical protein [Planctomycetota bacterium]